ncbi:hypothetical protein TVAG_452150 [Trichomonas vaginalis G3]|uniref:Uncharacterized protein n=1 Tax=Trichomonas vaginalis (strain ATCC PRA-98 / G3) TaxID=412133 RepID=A2DJT7_TRIV3|nr:hypothetical protein TVAGG3_0290180 [Trichomonas vaginalis G3]EAY19301.1 hypothetical protein TVAG_452150 [Trichomonas vaginalis G3]KAI5527202.1 hypothetical protein TVAGG3_0290180 [Trichomonas vaginalis G3]|eukprot:XP_001580287.1 hypothetical protein [Trichomonas vaginalis G3]
MNNWQNALFNERTLLQNSKPPTQEDLNHAKDILSNLKASNKDLNVQQEKMYEVDAREYQMFLCWKSRMKSKIQKMDLQNQNNYIPKELNCNVIPIATQLPDNKSNKLRKINPALLTPPPLDLPNCNCPGLPYNPQFYQNFSFPHIPNVPTKQKK